MREIEKAEEVKMLIIWSVATTILSSIEFYYFLETKISNFYSWDAALNLAFLYSVVSLIIFALITVRYLPYTAFVTGALSCEVAILAVSIAPIPITICNIDTNGALVLMIFEIIFVIAVPILIYFVMFRFILNTKRKILKIAAIHGLVVFVSISAIIKFCLQ